MAKKFLLSTIAPAAFFLTLCIVCPTRAQVTLQCETPYTSNYISLVQMHNGTEQDYYLMRRTTNLIQVYQSICGGEVLWDYPIPAQYQSTTVPSLYAHDLTGDGTSEFILVVGLGNRTGILVVEPVTDLLLLPLDDQNVSYAYHSFADYDNDGLGELVVLATNLSTLQSKLQIYDTNGSTGFESAPTPAEFNLDPAFPNPFNASVSIPFELERQGDVAVRIFNVLGSQVAELSQPNLLPGTHNLSWNAGQLPSGSYFYSVILNGQEVGSQRIVLLK